MITSHLTETIAAIATPPGVGGVSIIRVSGSLSSVIIKKMTDLTDLVPNTIHHRYIRRDGVGFYDEALVAWFKAPRSYTGEDVVEIHCHGGHITANQILERIIELGARCAGQGEFTLRAFINGKIDLIKAESIIDLIESKTEKENMVFAQQLAGNLSHSISAIRDDLMDMVSHLEVHLDYPEDEVLAPQDRYTDRFNAATQRIDSLLATFRTGRILQEGFLIAIMGKPNVGKSSLLNALVKENRVIVSDQPGTTRDAVEVWMKIAGVPVRIVDTAGLHEATDKVEKMGIERSRVYLDKADLVLFVVDQSTGITRLDQEIMGSLPLAKTLGIINKMDIVANKPCSLSLDIPDVICISAMTEEGLPGLMSALEHRVLFAVGNAETGEPVLTNERQKEQLLKAKTHITEAIKALKDGLSEDFWLIGLKASLYDLSSILGQDVSEEVLTNIFSRFCVGK